MDTKRTPAVQLLFDAHLFVVRKRADQIFFWVSLFQWGLAVFIALAVSPTSWSGSHRSVNVHVWFALGMGGALTLPVLYLTRFRTGSMIARQTVAVTAALWSVLLMHLCHGRIEVHFHVFVALAFLMIYRDTRMIVTATVLTGLDHFLGGRLWSVSTYGEEHVAWWRFMEHTSWVLFEAVVLVIAIRGQRKDMMRLASRQADAQAFAAEVEAKVIARTHELERSQAQYRALLENARTIPWEMDINTLAYTYAGPQMSAFLECDPDQIYDQIFVASRVHPEDLKTVNDAYTAAMNDKKYIEIEYRIRRSNGDYAWMRTLIDGPSQSDERLRGFSFDITERRTLEVELQQAQKLESVGRLASGIAHEINTPIQFVNDSVHFVRDAWNDLFPLLKQYGELCKSLSAQPAYADRLETLAEAEEEADVEYLEENVPKALNRAIDGLDRVAGLVRSMKEFAHPDQRQKSTADLNHALDTTLTIARNEYKYVADVKTEFGTIPTVVCHVNQLNQVFLNLIVNAAHAISDRMKQTGQRGRITIRTGHADEHVWIDITDTGGGIPEHVREKIFDPFFTTKEVGKGTGQGLAIARSVVVEKHGGTLTFDTVVGEGTTFHIRLPLTSYEQKAAA